MHEVKVWQCIVVYRPNDAKLIAKRFEHNRGKILKALSGYSQRAAYHGHKSGKPGDATASQADANLNSAITFLKNCAIPQQGLANVPDKVKKAQNEQELAMLMEVIKIDRPLPDIREDLNMMDPAWESLKKIKNEYERVRQEKKQLHTNKLAKNK